MFALAWLLIQALGAVLLVAGGLYVLHLLYVMVLSLFTRERR